MKHYITLNQEVEENIEYVSCQEGEFDEYVFVLCKHKNETQDCTIMFYSNQIKKIDESSS
jgi:hypothetical protein